MKSKRSNEGYLLIDHSNSPGIDAREINLMDSDLPINIGRTKFECPTYTCSHCQTGVILNPLRQRERGYCGGCDHYICDECATAKAAGATCMTFHQIADIILEKVVRGEQVEGLFETLVHKKGGIQNA